MELFKENKKAILFLVVFVGLYLALNTTYGAFIQFYYPSSDPFTRWVTVQSAWVLSLFGAPVFSYPSPVTPYIAVGTVQEKVIYVFEGCNGLNVMIVYLCFLMAFRGPVQILMKFACVGVAAIHAINLARISLLYAVAMFFPEQLYFFHKYLFTGIIYGFVFMLWFFWVRQVRNE
ncbi:hypothetical protein WSM22_43450 [Cytophagales bacterium WSM2-2]|nr:hypothetical protein WSM22_43450 [Cytophagales bacterium WSM2-2]